MRSYFPPARPSILVLFGTGRPFAVFRGVWAIVVPAINSVLRGGSRSHIGKEPLKRYAPRITNYNTPSAPIGIARIVGIFAAIYHSGPSIVFRKALSAPSCAMRNHVSAAIKEFLFSAPVAFGFSEQAALNNNALTAIAKTKPASSMWTVGAAAQNGKALKLLSNWLHKGELANLSWVAMSLPSSIMHGAKAATFMYSVALGHRTNNHRPNYNCYRYSVQA